MPNPNPSNEPADRASSETLPPGMSRTARGLIMYR